MPLAVGTRLGPYEILAPLGSGGMGEVYRARDTRIGREIALKILPSSYSENADRLHRFEQEARTAGMLNHPNLLAIYDVGKDDGSPYIVSELLEGETLREKLRSGALPTRRVTEYGIQLATGLAAAHDKGIIHRDLKPENLFITKDGRLKILDFGLAKLHSPEPVSLEGQSQLGTIASESTPGVILGTVGYMSPEQVRGFGSDQRSDIFAFGALLYEMLTGKRAFAGNTPADTLSAILQKDPPDLTQSGSDASPALDRIIRHCLEKEPNQRFQSARDVAFALEALSGSSESQQTTKPLFSPKKNREGLWKIAAAVCFLAALASIAALLTRKQPSTKPLEVTYLDIAYPPGVEPYSAWTGAFSISPDGRSIAIMGVRDGVRKLFIRRLERPDATEIGYPGGMSFACFSPDGASVAFISANSLIRVSLVDQQRSVIETKVDSFSAITWSSNGIVFNRGGTLWIVPQLGGTARQLTSLDKTRHEVLHSDPRFLPGGHILLFSSFTTNNDTDRIEAVSIENGQTWVLMEHANTPLWSPTGHLIFARYGAVFAVGLDPTNAKILGPAVRVIPSGIVARVLTGGLGLQISSNGTLIFAPIDIGTSNALSVNRDGSEAYLNILPNEYYNPRISPDGRRLLIENQLNSIDNIDLTRGTRARLTPPAWGTAFSTWTSDGKTVVFRQFNVPFWIAADGSAKSGPMPGGTVNDFPSAAGPDSDSVLVVRYQSDTSGSGNVYLMSHSGKFPPKPLISTPAFEGGPELSFDNKWLVYQSNESGQSEIYVRRYPALDRAWQVSEGGGVQPRWSTTGQEIYYRTGRKMMAVAFNGSAVEPTFGKPISLFEGDYNYGQGASIANYAVTRDGRFIMLRGSRGNSLRVVVHWTEELKKILAESGVH